MSTPGMDIPKVPSDGTEEQQEQDQDWLSPEDTFQYILECISIKDAQKESIIGLLGINRVEILETLSTDEIKEMHKEAISLKKGNVLLLIKPCQWLAWYQSKHNGQLPSFWLTEFDHNTLFKFN